MGAAAAESFSLSELGEDFVDPLEHPANNRVDAMQSAAILVSLFFNITKSSSFFFLSHGTLFLLRMNHYNSVRTPSFINKDSSR